MIRVGTSVHQAILCPTCGMEARLFQAVSPIVAVLVCRNGRCLDKDTLFGVDRMTGKVISVEKKETDNAKLGKTTQGR